ncbi:MAG TPA: hypothetical protein GXX34_07640 [Clostridia bacterium]|nr:hypothetical protein [Clostridia bacterium]
MDKSGEEVSLEEGKVFALDIGTKTVVGLVAQPEDDGTIKVLDIEVREHPERAMLGGQIHDIPKVARTISDIKTALETRLGTKLHGAAVAAAGRSLLSTCSKAELSYTFPQEVTEEILLTLQLEAVKQAQQQIKSTDQGNEYHCVGFSLLHQYLDDVAIKNLLGQIGKKIAVEIIATFLPRVVVDSLHTAINKAGLEMKYITLEPIAAINLAVPDSMRQLNIAMIDIGAGTSDIAVVDKNTIRGYGMIPMAGDQVTEALCEAFLLDFHTGEEVKRQLSSHHETVTFYDITRHQQSVARVQVLTAIQDTVTFLVRQIADKVLEINGRPPQAVLLVGGGSLTPTLPQELAKALNLPENRVAVIGDDITAPIKQLTGALASPQGVTPLAIAADALFHRSLDIMTVSVNHRPVRLFAANKLTVGDALVAAGISPSQYLGRMGPAISLEVNNEIVFVKGQPGQTGQIRVNDQDGELTTEITEGDRITFTPGTTGAAGKGTIMDVLPQDLIGKEIYVNSKRVPMLSQIKLDNHYVNSLHLPLRDGCKVEFTALTSVARVIRVLGYDPAESLRVIINGQECFNYETPVSPGDVLEILPDQAAIKKNEPPVEPANYVEIKVNEQPVRLTVADGEQAILTDIFKVIDFDTRAGHGRKLLLEVNGQPASFVTPINSGDVVRISWVEK